MVAMVTYGPVFWGTTQLYFCELSQVVFFQENREISKKSFVLLLLFLEE